MIYIDRLNGQIVDVEKDYLVLDVHGVGYMVYMSAHALQNLPCDEEILLYIQQQITEFDTRLFGFINKKDKNFFSFLYKIKGVNAKITFSILDHQDIFAAAVTNNEKKELENLPGIGKKIAERLIVESHKFVQENFACNENQITQNAEFQKNIIELKSALKNLGYKQTQINNAIKNFTADAYKMSIEELIKQSLLMIK